MDEPTTPVPTPRTITFIDYDITLASGKEFQFALRLDAGDTEEIGNKGDIALYLARTGHHVNIAGNHVAVLSRRERIVTLPAEDFKPKSADAPKRSNVIPINIPGL